MADETSTSAAPAKPGWQTTEFWIHLIVQVCGVVMAVLPSNSQAVRIAGMVMSAVSALGYGATRASIKNAAQVIVLVMLPLFMIGCTKGMIRADAIDGLTTDVCDRHDAMISGKIDPKTISEADKATYLRSTLLLRKVLQEAKSP